MATALHITLLKTVVLKEFPSGSAMEFFNDRLYLIGDDARQIAVLDSAYEPIDYILLFESDERRISKIEKVDLEASAIIQQNGQAHLLAIGSASRSLRERVILLSLPGNAGSTFEIFDTKKFTSRLSAARVPEINIEGAATVGDQLVLSNRGNKNHPDNLLFITSPQYFLEQDTTPLQILKIQMPVQDFPIGISALSYHQPTDTLYFTASVEQTLNAFDDGVIGDSWLGIITQISTRLQELVIEPDGLLNLTKTDIAFNRQKIESICFEYQKGPDIIAHLVSDNDDGESNLFKVQISVVTGEIAAG
ncbi:MAG: hypothetical protein ABIX01_03910 [Chitinophagaceae bacterium]